ncbi:MAG: FG-GAP repeat protein, partial [Ignavibacteriae bacterium]|nr:FG-GAP repeat protein [Ignavibacteriota bacterium]
NVFGYYGSSTGILFADFLRESNSANALFGFSVSTAGDVNGDGYSDIIIGAPGANSNKGYAVSYLGSASGLQTTANWYKVSPAVNPGDHKFGYCVSTAGDVNGDGYSDVILGAPFAGSESGYAYVFHGSSTGLLINPNWTYSFNSPGQRFGISVATTGDVNGDGYSDIIVGSKNYFGNPAAFFLKGSPTGISGNVVQLYGIYVSTAGDVNGDGYS